MPLFEPRPRSPPREELQKLGWTEGRNVRVDTRWATPADVDSMQRFAKELVALQPDLILSNTTPTTAAPSSEEMES
jgi:putative ABC transport system substrate-binding protein